MGQRLNIEIKRRKDNKVLANSYYHWSAYTSSSLHLAEEINESYEEEIKSGKLDLNNLTEFDFSLEEMTLNDIRLFMSKLDEIENNNGLFRVKGTDLIYQIIY